MKIRRVVQSHSAINFRNLLAKLLGIEWRSHLCVIIEVDENIAMLSFRSGFGTGLSPIFHLFSARPCDDPMSPLPNRLRGISARIKLFAAVKTAINKVRGHIHQQRPFHGVGHDQGDVPYLRRSRMNSSFTKLSFRISTAWRSLPSLHRLQPRAAIQPLVVLSCKLGGIGMGLRQQGKEILEPFSVIAEVWRELPKNGAEFVRQAAEAPGRRSLPEASRSPSGEAYESHSGSP